MQVVLSVVYPSARPRSCGAAAGWFPPKKIKMAITGNGNASKEQVAKMLQQLLGLKTLPKNLDSTDGLAAAVCHFFNSGKVVGAKSYTGWDAFVKQNDERINK